MTRSVYVARAGIITAAGSDLDSTWRACNAALPTAREARFELPRANPPDLIVELPFCSADHERAQAAVQSRFGRSAKRTTDNAALGLYAVSQVLDQETRARINPSRTAVIWGSGSSSINPIEQGYAALMLAGKARVNPMTVADSMASATAAAIASLFELTGPSFATASACASSAHAIALGQSLIASGLVDDAIVGGSEVLSDPGAIISWQSTGVLAKTPTRPFHRERDGINLGDGAAALLLTANPENAMARLGPIAMSTGAKDIMAPLPEAVLECLGRIATHPADPDRPLVINCHATGTKTGDAVEMECLEILSRRIGRQIICSTTKGITGHTMSASGAVEAVIALLSLAKQTVPVAHAVEDGQWHAIPATSLAAQFDRIYSASYGFGGMNCLLSFDRMGQRQ